MTKPEETSMKKTVLPALTAFLFCCVTCAFAVEFRKSDATLSKSDPRFETFSPEKPGSTRIRTTAPAKSRNIDPDAAKLAHAVLPKVTFPTMSHQVGYEDRKFAITVRFNTDMDRNSVTAGVNVILDFPRAANAPGQITWISDREFTWVQQSENRFVICTYDPDCEFKLTLKDSILSKEGLKLDGDNDNRQGGDFSLWLIDLG